jgi:PAS domain S-box-containing protein
LAIVDTSPERASGLDLSLDAESCLRLGGFCRDLWRASNQFTNTSDLFTIAASLAVRDLNCAAVGLWLWDAEDRAWRLTAAAGRISGAEITRIAIRDRELDNPPDSNQCVDAAVPLLRSAFRRKAESESRANFAVAPIEGYLSGLGMIALWFDHLDPYAAGAMAYQAADDLADVAGAIARQTKERDLARLSAAVVDCSPCAIIGLNRDQCCTRWNTAAMQMFGWPEREVLGKRLPLVRDERAVLQDSFTRCLSSRLPVRSSFTGQRWDGSECAVQAVFCPLVDGQDNVHEVLMLVRDDTAAATVRNQVQLNLEVSSLLVRTPEQDGFCASLTTMIGQRLDCRAVRFWTSDEHGAWRATAEWTATRAASLNPLERLGGDDSDGDEELRALAIARREILCPWLSHDEGRPLRSVPPKEFAVDVAVPIIAGDDVPAVLFLRGLAPGSDPQRLSDLLENLARQVGQTIDRERSRTRMAQMESSLRQSRKVEAVGMLAGGIIHDFNNLLTVVLGNCELAKLTCDLNDRAGKFVDEIQLAGERAAGLARQLLGFTRKREVQPTHILLCECLRQFRPVLQRIVGRDVELELDEAEGQFPVLIDGVELEQVLLNLAANSRDAMPRGGRLAVTTRCVELSLRDVAAFPSVKPGEFIELAVADTGCGMDEATRRRMFEPFFTTKGAGHGTGLGMATVFDIVQRASGTIQVWSQIGKGTRVAIYLPRAAAGIAVRQVDAAPGESPRGTEHVVLVEDETALRSLTQQILEVHGYRVASFASGREAIEYVRSHRSSVELLITDLMMPVMSGDEVARQARRHAGDLPVVFTSGHHELLEAVGREFGSGASTLRKPFTSDQLAVAVRRALDRSPVTES